MGMTQSSQRPTYAEVTPAPLTAPVAPGSTVRAILNVKVAPGFHIQSDKPRDPSLIPLTVTLDAPPGVSLAGLVFPPSKDFTLKGTDQPLAVFEGTFPIEARLAIAESHPGGETSVPVRVRYQACDETTCFRPMTITTAWTTERDVYRTESGRPCSPSSRKAGAGADAESSAGCFAR